jgi:hypothetical protein
LASKIVYDGTKLTLGASGYVIQTLSGTSADAVGISSSGAWKGATAGVYYIKTYTSGGAATGTTYTNDNSKTSGIFLLNGVTDAEVKGFVTSAVITKIFGTDEGGIKKSYITAEKIGEVKDSVFTLTSRKNATSVLLNGAGNFDLSSTSLTGIKDGITVGQRGVSVKGGDGGMLFITSAANSTIAGGSGDDTYNWKLASTSATYITDAGGADTYNLTLAGSGISIVDKGNGNDKFNISNKLKATIQSADGEDVYTIGSAATVSLTQTAGTGKVDISKAATATLGGGSAATYNLTVSSAAVVDAANFEGTLNASFSSSASLTVGKGTNNVSIVGAGTSGVTLAGASTTNVTLAGDKAIVKAGNHTGNNHYYIGTGDKGARGYDITAGKGTDTYTIGNNTSGTITEQSSSGSKNTIDSIGNQNYVTFAAGTASYFESLNIAGNKNTLANVDGTSVSLVGADNLAIATAAAASFNVTGTNNSINANNGKEDTFTFGGGSSVSIKADTSDKINLTDTNANVSVQGAGGTVTVAGSGNKLTWSADSTAKGIISITGAAAYVENKSKTGAEMSIMSGSKDATVIGGEGNDTFAVEAAFASINGGKGSDSYYIVGDEITGTINDTEGADTYSIKGAAANLILADSTGKDKVVIGGKDVSITATGTQDVTYTVETEASGANVVAGNGKDTVSVAGTNGVFAGGAGADSFKVSGDGNAIYGGDDNDAVVFDKGVKTATVDGGAGKDTISVVEGMNASITLGDGADRLELAKNSTVTVADVMQENDVIKLSASSVKGESWQENGGYTTIKLTDGAVLNLAGTMSEVKLASVTGGATSIKAVADLFAGNEEYAVPATDTVAPAEGQVVSLSAFNESNSVAFLDSLNAVGYAANADSIIGTGKNNKYTAEKNAAGQNISGVGASAGWDITGTKNADSIVGSDHNDTIYGNGGADTIEAGAGNDYVYAVNGALISTGTGKDTIDTTTLTGSASVNGFDAENGVIMVSDLSKLGMLDSGSGFVVGDNATLYAPEVDGALFVNVQQPGGKVARYGAIASNVEGKNALTDNTDASSKDSVAKLIVDKGSNNYLHGGKKADTIYAGAGDSIWGAGGNDDINLNNTAGTAEKVGLLANSGKDSVSGFVQGFEDSADAIWFYDAPVVAGNVAINKQGQVEFTYQNSKVILADSVTGGAAYVRVQDNSVNGDNAIKVAVGSGKNSSVALGADPVTSEYADIYLDGPVDFSGKSGDVSVNLGDNGDMGWFNADGTQLYRVNYVKGTDNGNNMLVGNAEKNTLVGGAGGNNSLFGGFSNANDLLVGNADSDDVFFFGDGTGNDTIRSAGATDKVVLYNAASVHLTSLKDGVATFVNKQKLTFDGAIETGFKAEFTDGTYTYNGSTWDWQAK